MLSSKLYSLSSAQFPRLHASPVLRPPRLARSLAFVAMAAKTDVQLDKNTPEHVWKEVLSTEQVRKRLHELMECRNTSLSVVAGHTA